MSEDEWMVPADLPMPDVAREAAKWFKVWAKDLEQWPDGIYTAPKGAAPYSEHVLSVLGDAALVINELRRVAVEVATTRDKVSASGAGEAARVSRHTVREWNAHPYHLASPTDWTHNSPLHVIEEMTWRD